MGRKRSTSVYLSLVTIVAGVLLGGCTSSEEQVPRYLVDRNTGKVLPDSLGRHAGHHYYYYGHPIYPWYVYGGTYRNGVVSNYSLTAPSQTTSSSSKARTVSRGGFGRVGAGRTVAS